MDFATISNRLRAVVDELDEDESFEMDESEELSEDDLLEAQVEALAALLGVEVADLMEASEDEVIEALGALNNRLTEMKMKYASQGVTYGRSGLKRSSMPWARNEPDTGYATKHAAPSHDGPPTTNAKQSKPNPPTYGPSWMK